MEKLYEYLNIATDKIVFFAPKVLLAAVIAWIGIKIIKKMTTLVKLGLEKSGFTNNFTPFLISVADIVLKISLIFIIATILGANLTGFIAILAAAGFAIGMALQGSLGNFASGILVLSFKPYQMDDWIQIGDDFGQVEEIGIFNTKIITRDHNTLIVPNSMVTDSVITNFSLIGTRRIEVLIPIPYSESFPKVKKLINEALFEIPTVLKDPKPVIEIDNYDTHSVIIAVRPYALPDQYWEAARDTKAVLKKIFHENNIKIAYVEGFEMGEIGE